MERMASAVWEWLKHYPMLVTTAVISLLLALPTIFSADGVGYKLIGFLVVMLVVLPAVYSIREWPDSETTAWGEPAVRHADRALRPIRDVGGDEIAAVDAERGALPGTAP